MPSRLGPAVPLALVLGALLVLAGCGGDKSLTKADTTTANTTTIAPAPSTGETTTRTSTTPITATTTTAKKPKTTTTATTTAKKPQTTTTATKQATPPPTHTQTTPPQHETSSAELAKRSKARAEQAANAGAKTCPTLTKPAAAKDITVRHISCATAKKIIFATTPKERSGFVCDIVNESFSDVPAVEYSCNRKADKATLGYTAVG